MTKLNPHQQIAIMQITVVSSLSNLKALAKTSQPRKLSGELLLRGPASNREFSTRWAGFVE
jgi:hypothetical protein